MTEIQRLEAEIKEKEMQLRHLKSLENLHLHYDSLLDSLRAKSESKLFVPELTDSMRSLALSVSSARRSGVPGSPKIVTYPKVRKVKQLPTREIAILNDMIAEIGPIVADYVWRFVAKSEVEDVP